MIMESKLIELESQRRNAMAHLRRAMRRSRRLAPDQLVHRHPYAAAGVAMAAGAAVALVPGRRKHAKKERIQSVEDKTKKPGIVGNAKELVQVLKQLMEMFLVGRGAGTFGGQEAAPAEVTSARQWEVQGATLDDAAW